MIAPDANPLNEALARLECDSSLDAQRQRDLFLVAQEYRRLAKSLGEPLAVLLDACEDLKHTWEASEDDAEMGLVEKDTMFALEDALNAFYDAVNGG